MPQKPPSRSRNSDWGWEDLKASLSIVEWLNKTIDAAARCLGKGGTRDAALVLLILHKNPGAMTGKRLVELYRAWSVAPRSASAEDTLKTGVGWSVRAGLLTIGKIGPDEVSTAKGDSAQQVLGLLLEKGLHCIRKIQLTPEGEAHVRAMTRAINDELDAVRKRIAPADLKSFDRVLRTSLPYPPMKISE